MQHLRLFISLTGCLILLIPRTKAQDPQFSQFYGVPLYTNPAFAGASGNIRINAAFRDQYFGISNNFRSYFGSLDADSKKLSGGVGLTFLNDVAGDGSLTTNVASGIYAFHTALTRKLHMRAAVQVSVVQKSYDFSRFRFGDQIDDRYGFVKPTMEPVGSQQRIFPNFGTGFLLYTDRLFGGVAVHNLIEPNQSFYYPSSASEQFRLPRRYTFHAGANVYLSHHRNEKDRVVLSPNLLFMNQRNYNQLNLGLYLKRQALTTGVWVRQTSKNADAVIILLGLKFPKFRLGYTYDVTVSGARTATQGSQEVSLSFEITPKHRPRGKKVLVCPDF